MRIRFDTPAALAVAARDVARHLPTRPSLPVLVGAILHASENTVTVSGYDHEIATRCTIPDGTAEVAETGRVMVSGRLLAEVTKLLPRQATELVADRERVVITAGSSRVTLPQLPIEDAPAAPAPPPSWGEVDAAELTDQVSRVAAAATTDQALIPCVVVAVDIPAAGSIRALRLFATDRVRLAAGEVAWTPTLEDDAPGQRVGVVAKELVAAVKALAADQGETIQLGVDTNGQRISLVTANREITLACLDVQLPPYDGLLQDRSEAGEVIVPAQELTGALRRLALHSDARTARAWFDDNLLSLSIEGDTGSDDEHLPVDWDGDPIEFGMNPAHLASATAAVGGDLVSIAVPDRTNRPWLLRRVTDDGTTNNTLRYLVMPLRLPGATTEAAA